MAEPLDAGTLDALRRIARYDTGQGEYAHVPCDVLGRLLDDHARLTAENVKMRRALEGHYGKITVDRWLSAEAGDEVAWSPAAARHACSAEAGDTDVRTDDEYCCEEHNAPDGCPVCGDGDRSDRTQVRAEAGDTDD